VAVAAIGGKPGFQPLRRVLVMRAPKSTRAAGHLIAGPFIMPCALGAGGIRHAKREGDGGTPAGRFRLSGGFFRADRLHRPASALRLAALRRDCGWCDDPTATVYNRRVRLPLAKSHEAMWRQDRLYDVVVVIDYNMAPRRKGRGSAIFLHIAADNYAPTAGCVALSPRDMRRLLPRLARDCMMIIR
jgi:L,D-peptidoglycan transpeptidase YkuD (ErfK/YbiS/YcfS/YnhG family)